MKRLTPSGDAVRFKGGVRCCHRASSRIESWDEWVNGETRPDRPRKNWLKIILITLAILALGGVFATLVIELGVG
jgi:hypothetical protein